MVSSYHHHVLLWSVISSSLFSTSISLGQRDSIAIGHAFVSPSTRVHRYLSIRSDGPRIVDITVPCCCSICCCPVLLFRCRMMFTSISRQYAMTSNLQSGHLDCRSVNQGYGPYGTCAVQQLTMSSASDANRRQ
jgi:hypothetical protein